MQARVDLFVSPFEKITQQVVEFEKNHKSYRSKFIEKLAVAESSALELKAEVASISSNAEL
jgi:hypothetical protein